MSAPVHESARAEIAKTVQSVLDKQLYARFVKKELHEDERLITGVVLIPDVVDAHGDIIPADVIQKAAFKFLAEYNTRTTLGIMHKDLDPPLALVESYIAPMDFVLGTQTIIKGSWLITVHVLDDIVWQKVKDGKYTGFSIGGKAVVEDLEEVVA